MAFLIRHVEIGQGDTRIRRDVSAQDLAEWIGWLIDGAAQSTAADRSGGRIDVREAVQALTQSREGAGG